MIARSEEGSLRDEIPQAGLGGSPTFPIRETIISKNQTVAEGYEFDSVKLLFLLIFSRSQLERAPLWPRGAGGFRLPP